jgi:hypothetical protein
MAAEPTPVRIAQCSICKAPVDQRFRPFCSRRCAEVDLARWVTGAYAIPGGNADADEDGDDTRGGRAEADERA